MRALLIVGTSLAAACSIPGIAPEGRELGASSREIPAPRTDVYNQALRSLPASGYQVITSASGEWIRAERALAEGRVNVIEARFSGSGSTTRVDVRAWTDIVTGISRRRASQYDAGLPHDVDSFYHRLSCPVVRWPGCP